MSEVLVLVDHVEGTVRKTTLELLTIARRIGEPSAVFIGSGYEAAKETLAQYGAAKVLVADAPELEEFLVAPKAEVVAQAAVSSPAAVLITSNPEGKEIAARLAIKLGSGIITDATDVAADLTTTQSVFAGSYTVTAKVTHGVPIITVKPNAVTPSRLHDSGRGEGRGGAVGGGEGSADRRPAAAGGHGPAGVGRSCDRRVRWARHGRGLRAGRGTGRRAGRCGRSVPGSG